MFNEDLEDIYKNKKRFNIIYNSNEDIGFGVGYYVVYENYKGEPAVDCQYRILEYSEQVDMVSVGIINKIYHLYDLGYILDPYYIVDLKDLF